MVNVISFFFLENEPNLLNINDPELTIVGDIHGYLLNYPKLHKKIYYKYYILIPCHSLIECNMKPSS